MESVYAVYLNYQQKPSQYTMRLLGRASWWAPRPLRRLYARYGISDEIQPERAGVPV